MCQPRQLPGAESAFAASDPRSAGAGRQSGRVLLGSVKLAAAAHKKALLKRRALEDWQRLARLAMRSSLLREHGQTGKSLKPSPANALRCSKTLPAFLVRTSSLRCAHSWANALRCSKTLPAFLVRTSSLRCARSRANASRCSKTLPAFLSLSAGRFALLSVFPAY
ncbi:type III-B CRISPR module-associated Cmr3 family protein [Pantoea agglomerans]|uniref:type III-B CRISPR module-associated Cmr3 family protein n=1 Tax=Enterobacter agglomerans TaxID=549 RepID=UPI0039C93240